MGIWSFADFSQGYLFSKSRRQKRLKYITSFSKCLICCSVAHCSFQVRMEEAGPMEPRYIGDSQQANPQERQTLTAELMSTREVNLLLTVPQRQQGTSRMNQVGLEDRSSAELHYLFSLGAPRCKYRSELRKCPSFGLQEFEKGHMSSLRLRVSPRYAFWRVVVLLGGCNLR